MSSTREVDATVVQSNQRSHVLLLLLLVVYREFGVKCPAQKR